MRRLEEKDFSDIAPFVKENFGRYHVCQAGDELDALLLQDFRGFYEENENTCYVYDKDGVLGLAAFRKLGWDSRIFGFNCAELKYLAMNQEDYQLAFDGLIGKIKEWTGKNRINLFSARTDKKNNRLVRSLNAEGFETIEELVTLRGEPGEGGEYGAGIRKGSVDEIETIGKISAESFVHSRFLKDKRFGEERARELKRKWAINCCNGRADEVLVATVDDNVCGFVTCNVEKVPEIELRYGDIQLIAVDKDYAGRGLGGLLVGAAKNWFAEQGCKFVDVSTQLENVPAIKLYEKQGFKIVDSKTTLHWWTTAQ